MRNYKLPFLTHSQAATVLGVTRQYVWKLVKRGKLTTYTFFGRKYVSMNEIGTLRNK